MNTPTYIRPVSWNVLWRWVDYDDDDDVFCHYLEKIRYIKVHLNKKITMTLLKKYNNKSDEMGST